MLPGEEKQPETANVLDETKLRLDALGRKDYHIWQDPERFCFGIDAVLLADFAKAGPDERVLDLGTGNGILPLLLAARDKGAAYEGLELQPEGVELARRNAEMNGLQEIFRVREGDLKEASALYGKAAFDVVISNPPYLKGGPVNPRAAKALARHELSCCLDDVIRESAACLKLFGRLYLVYRPERLAELLSCMRQYRIEPKTLRLVHSFPDGPARLVLVEGVRGARSGMRVLRPLILYVRPGVYTDEVHEMYYGK